METFYNLLEDYFQAKNEKLIYHYYITYYIYLTFFLQQRFPKLYLKTDY